MNSLSAVRPRRHAGFGLLAAFCMLNAAAAIAQAPAQPSRKDVEAQMRRATEFMVEKVAYRGGYLWNYLPDFSRRWGEMEARETMIWLQPPGTSSMGHVFLDAYHATGDEYYYRAAEQVGAALIWGQHPSGGWNYVVDFAGDRSLRDWYATVGRNAWRLEEFQHYYGNATFDDQVDDGRRDVPAAPVRGETRSALQGARSIAPSRSCSTASIPSAAGRSVSRCATNSPSTAAPTTARISRSTTTWPGRTFLS